MAPLVAVDTTVNNRTYDYTEKAAFEVYTIEESWEEIDKI